MRKYNLSFKTIKKQILSINNLIESNFNKIKYFKSNYKKILFNRHNKVTLGLVIVVILTLFYFLVPTSYDKKKIKYQIENQILKKYNVKLKLSDKINYRLLPKPHFSIKNLSILNGENEIASVKNLKVFIKISKFLPINKIIIQDLMFVQTDFSIGLDDFLFFKKLINVEANENEILFKNSNVFFKDPNEEVLFINQVETGKFYYDSKKLQNVLFAKNQLFKIPYKIQIKNDKFNKKILVNFDSKKIRLNINNLTDYDKKKKEGKIDILFLNKDTSINYQIQKNLLTFSSSNNKNFYDGKIDFKPFYLSTNFNYEGINIKNFFDENSILIDFIDSEIFTNKNFSADLSFNVKKITNINQLSNLKFNVLIEEGKVNFSNSSIMWGEDCKITINDSLLSINDYGINVIGKIILSFKDIDKFYSSFQIQKKNRKKIKKIQLDYVYNFNTKNMSFDNIKVDNARNPELENFINNFNSQQDRAFNKITFKNFINNFLNIYSG